MKHAIIIFAIATALIINPCAFALEQEIEIKGLKIGMTTDEVEAKIGLLPVRNFTIAGIRNHYSRFNVSFHDGKLDNFSFFFNSDSFEDMLEAVQSKYPSMICSDSKVSNAMGASFNQISCSLTGVKGELKLYRFTDELGVSHLILLSNRFLEEYRQKREDRKKDL